MSCRTNGQYLQIPHQSTFIQLAVKEYEESGLKYIKTNNKQEVNNVYISSAN
uniref:Uncharacterized protein n=1 Tax=Arundo donax TaxID=35708 RepID=A0A0A9FB42_ARUDO